MMSGTVKSWRPEKGFGFIKLDGEGEDHFVHISDCLGDARRVGFAVGDRVEFESRRGERGPRAANVRAAD